jgi:hypothetical protein
VRVTDRRRFCCLLCFGAPLAGVGSAFAREGVDVGEPSVFSKAIPAEQIERAASGQYLALLQENANRRSLAPDNHPQLRRLRAIAARIIPHTYDWNPRAREWKWEVNLIGSKQINAFCMPGGKIAFYYGILDRLKLDDDEVAMVMGHEMAHALREHAREQMARLTQPAPQSRSAPPCSARQWGRLLADMGGQLLTMQFGREDESEADLVGLELAARAGYDPRGGVTLWQKMAAANERQPVELLSTHPSGPTRISNIEANLPKVEGLYERARKAPGTLRAAVTRAQAPDSCSEGNQPRARAAPLWRSVLFTGGRTATWRTSARMLSAPVFWRMLPIWLRIVEIATPSSRQRAPAGCRCRARPARASLRSSGRSCARSPGPRASRRPSACRGRRARRAGRSRRLRAGSTETLARSASLPSVSRRRMPRSDASLTASCSGATSRARRARSSLPSSCSGWRSSELDAGGVVDVDDVRAVEQEDDAVVELVQRRGKPVPHGLRHALAGPRSACASCAGSSDDGGMHSLRSGLGAGSCEHVPLLRCRASPARDERRVGRSAAVVS